MFALIAKSALKADSPWVVILLRTRTEQFTYDFFCRGSRRDDVGSGFICFLCMLLVLRAPRSSLSCFRTTRLMFRWSSPIVRLCLFCVHGGRTFPSHLLMIAFMPPSLTELFFVERDSNANSVQICVMTRLLVAHSEDSCDFLLFGRFNFTFSFRRLVGVWVAVCGWFWVKCLACLRLF